MIYYKVKPESDQFVVSRKSYPLIANDLFTANEYSKIRYEFMKIGGSTQALKEKFVLVDIPKNKTYFMFGARFAEG